jgi:hypothetical protein
MKNVITVFLMFASVSSVFAQSWTKQSSLEFGLFLGASSYKGELSESLFEPRSTKFNGGLLTRWNPNERITFKLAANYGQIEGNDQWYSGDTRHALRNLSFKTRLWEFSGNCEINLRRLGYKKESGAIPYISFGLAVFKYNPLAQFIYDPNSAVALELQSYSGLANRDGDWVELQPLGTEGQGTTEFNSRKRYSLTQLSIPISAGVKFKIDKKWTFGLEYGVRKTFTDYLDDVSMTYVPVNFLEGAYGPLSAAMSDRSPVINTAEINTPPRGDDGNKDWYSIFGVTLTYRIYTSRVRCFQF